jgi:hypothetical protein
MGKQKEGLNWQKKVDKLEGEEMENGRGGGDARDERREKRKIILKNVMIKKIYFCFLWLWYIDISLFPLSGFDWAFRRTVQVRLTHRAGRVGSDRIEKAASFSVVSDYFIRRITIYCLWQWVRYFSLIFVASLFPALQEHGGFSYFLGLKARNFFSKYLGANISIRNLPGLYGKAALSFGFFLVL